MSTSRIGTIPTNQELFLLCTREWYRRGHLGLDHVVYIHIKPGEIRSWNDELHSKWLRSTCHNKKITILTKQGKDTTHAVITMKYQKYTSTAVLKHANVLAKVNKFIYVHLLNMMPHDAYSNTIHIHTMTISDICH